MKKREVHLQTTQHDCQGNYSGYLPIDTKVLVLPDFIDETSEGGIVLTSETVKQNELAITEGFIVDWGKSAFADWESGIPVIMGHRVVWASYAGQMLAGDDGLMYRLINDTDLVAVRAIT